MVLSQYRSCVATSGDEKRAFLCVWAEFAIILYSEIRDVHQFPIDTYYFYRAKKYSEIRNNT